MEKYLISLDLDGTILNKKEKIPFLTKVGLKYLLKNGHYVILNSGRPFQGMLKYVKELNLFNYPFIASNGGCIYYVNHQYKIIKTHPFFCDKKIVIDFFNKIKPYLKFAYFQGISNTYFYHRENMPSFIFHDSDLVKFQDIDEFNLEEDLITGSFAINEEYKNEIDKLMQKEKYQSLYFMFWESSSEGCYYDFSSSQTNKGKAMLHLAKLLKVKNANILAFGDAKNDLPMLSLANKGCLMPEAENLNTDNQFTVLKKDSNHSGVINYLFKNYRDLF